MKKFWAFLKNYWFGLLMSFVLLMGFLFFLLIMLSPRYDAQKRGFIPCTENLVQNLAQCAPTEKYTCGIKHILANTWCDIKVIATGWKNWGQGKQATPWSNYIFEPEPITPIDENDEFYADYKARGLTARQDMQNLIKMGEALDQQVAAIKKEKEDEEKR